MAKLAEINEKSKSVQPFLVSSKLLGSRKDIDAAGSGSASATQTTRTATERKQNNKDVEMDSDFEEDADLEFDWQGGNESEQEKDEEKPVGLSPALGSALKSSTANGSSFGSALKKAQPALAQPASAPAPTVVFGSALRKKDTSSSVPPPALPSPPKEEPSPQPFEEPKESFLDDAALAKAEEKARKRREQRQRQKEARKKAREALGGKPNSDDSSSDSDTYSAPKPKPIPQPASKPTQPTDQTKHATPSNLQTSRYIQPIPRPDSLLSTRFDLPILQYESKILDTVLHNPVTIICGSTGSGKTTQVPQMLYEFGFSNPEHPLFSGNIVVTEPRRVAAVGVAKRVAEEMGELGKQVVGYQVRYDRSEGLEKARIKFVTDGILLRELSSAASAQEGDKEGGKDLLLQQYSCIILDEAHERTIGTDVLIGWLSRIVKLRNSEQARRSGVKPLRLIIMSATLRVQDFAGNRTLFETAPPVVNVQGRQFKVVVHFQRRTPQGLGAYVKEAFRKLCKIHERLPGGGVLVFLSGRAEIDQLVRLLRNKYPKKRGIEREKEQLEEKGGGTAEGANKGGEGFVVQDDAEVEDDDAGAEAELDAELGRAMADVEDDDDGSVGSYDEGYGSEEDEVAVLQGDDDDEDEQGKEGSGDPNLQEQIKTPSSTPRDQIPPLHILPLHSLLPTTAQMRIFKDTPQGHRLVVVATNIAETSLTIPGIRYVLDAGKVKSRDFDPRTGVQRFVTGWTSRASADQRAGRAGRVGVGHCYRLFSSAVYADQFQEWTDPEIKKAPLEGVILQMKAMGITQVSNFPYPTPPDRDRLRAAEKLLTYLGAIDPASIHLSATSLGTIMGKLPISPRYAKMIVLAAQQSSENNVLAHVIALVAGLSVPGEVFVRPSDVLAGTDGKMGGEDEDEDEEGEAREDVKELRKKRHGSYWRSMAMFAGPDPTSDHLRVLGAIGAYEHHRHSNRGDAALEKFCREHFLNAKSMAEISKLRAQLTGLVKVVMSPYSSASANVKENLSNLTVSDPRMPPPNNKQRNIIGQLLFAGFPDQLAMLRPLPATVAKNTKLPNYATLETPADHPVHIHPASCLGPVRPGPPWLVYTEIVGRDEVLGVDGETVHDARGQLKDPNAAETRLLKICTIVREPWITALAPAQLCSFSEILEDPAPEYDPIKDTITCYAKATYAGKWQVGGTIRVPFPLGPTAPSNGGLVNKCKWFARFLLEGKVFPSGSKHGPLDPFAVLAPHLVQPARTVTAETAKHLKRVNDFIKALAGRKIDSRKALLEAWKADPKFLKAELMAWLPEPLQQIVDKQWPLVKPNSGSPQGWKVNSELAGLLLDGDSGKAGKKGAAKGGRGSGWTVADSKDGGRFDSDDED